MLGLSTRSSRALSNEGITTFSQLVSFLESESGHIDILKIPDLGKKSALEIAKYAGYDSIESVKDASSTIKRVNECKAYLEAAGYSIQKLVSKDC